MSETLRAAIARAAVYATDRLTDVKSLTQADVIAAATIVPTSDHEVKHYSREIRNAAESRLRPEDAVADSSRPTEGPSPSFFAATTPRPPPRPPVRARSRGSRHLI